jgi:hypothetical protein
MANTGLLIILIWLGIVWAVYGQTGHTTVKYDCRIAEISPDVPQAVKEQCRKLQKGIK